MIVHMGINYRMEQKMNKRKILGFSLGFIFVIGISKNIYAQEKNGWISQDNSWYYYTKDSAVKNSWVGDFYLKSDGKMAKSEWIFDSKYNSYFYIRENGQYAKNMWIKDYYLKSDGKMAKSEWIFDKNLNAHYYIRENGAFAKDMWIKNNYLKSDGKMAKSEWIFDKNYNSYYYIKENGEYAKNMWIGDFYLKENGERANSEWILDSKYNSHYYLGEDGKYLKSQIVGNYYVGEDGKRVNSKWIFDKLLNGYIYVKDNGIIAKNEFIDNYYLKSNGLVAKNEWIIHSNGKYMYINEKGNASKGLTSVAGKSYMLDESGFWIENTGEAMAKYAQTFVGKLDYLYGGRSLTLGTDCSGFTLAIHQKFNINIPRVTSSQLNAGKKIKREELQPGDLIIYDNSYGGHVTMYIGNGKVVHMSVPGTKCEIRNSIEIPGNTIIGYRRNW